MNVHKNLEIGNFYYLDNGSPAAKRKWIYRYIGGLKFEIVWRDRSEYDYHFSRVGKVTKIPASRRLIEVPKDIVAKALL